MTLRLKSFAKMFFRKKERHMHSRVRPSSKSPTKLPRRHVIKEARSSSDFRDEEDEDYCSTISSYQSTTISSYSSTSSSSSSEATKKSGKLCCDKCDGAHETNRCPHYKTKRGSHPDEQKNFYKKLGGVSKLPGQTLRSARVVRQPGDGSCLFHSMSYGLGDGTSASSLRRHICAFIAKNPKLLIADTPLSDWVKWDSRGSVTSYVAKMSCGAWGGGIEMACMSLLKNCNVHVYERSRLGYTRISAFDHPSSPEKKKTIKVLYGGGIHYGEL